MTSEFLSFSLSKSIALRRVLLIGCLMMSGPATAANSTDSHAIALRDGSARVQGFVDEFHQRLDLRAQVRISIVAENPLLVSVAPPVTPGAAYTIAIEQRFLDQLNDEDLRAVVAHELGHVWIFTHHPYLQTEALANQIAQRLVTRRSLEHVYALVRDQGIDAGTVARFADTR
jgi:hypothetical protein